MNRVVVDRSQIMDIALAYVAHDGRPLKEAILHAMRQVLFARRVLND